MSCIFYSLEDPSQKILSLKDISNAYNDYDYPVYLNDHLGDLYHYVGTVYTKIYHYRVVQSYPPEDRDAGRNILSVRPSYLFS